ncbi:MAG: hypothetical protein CMH69_14150 [Nitratireductor sp.]|nr:hypothetical protein [Nitratireductor sp.]
MKRFSIAACLWSSITALILSLAADGSLAEDRKLAKCTSEPVEHAHILGEQMQNGALAARVFLVRFSPKHKVLQFDREMVEIWDQLRLWERALDEALADPTVSAEIRDRAKNDEATAKWMAYLSRYHRTIARLEEVDTTERDTIDAAIEYYVANLASWRRQVVSPQEYRSLLIGTQHNYETERGLPGWQALLQAAHAVENHIDQRAGQIVTEANIKSLHLQARRDWQLRLALSQAAIADEDFDERLLGHYISYRQLSLNCASYIYRDGVVIGANGNIRRLLEWLPEIQINRLDLRVFGFETRDWQISLLAKPNFSSCYIFIENKSDKARSMSLEDRGCAGKPTALGDESLTSLQARQAALFEDYSVLDVTGWMLNWAEVPEILAGPTVVRYLRSKGDFFETQATGAYDIDITTVHTSKTIETRNGINTLTDSSTAETSHSYKARTIDIMLGPDEMRLVFHGTGREWQCFHGLVGKGRTQLLDATFLDYRKPVDRVIFNTGACPGVISSMFVNSDAVDGLFGVILQGRYMKEMNGLINILSRTVIETVEALEKIED